MQFQFRFPTLFAMAAALGAGGLASASDYDEMFDGDLPGIADGAYFFDVELGDNSVTGTVGDDGGLDEDFIAFTVEAGEALSAITLTGFVPSGGNTSTGFRLYADLGSGLEQVGPGSFTTNDIGVNYLTVWDLSDVGGSIPLGPGVYGVVLAEFTPNQAYSFDITIIPAPGSLAFLGVGALAMTRRRR